MKKKKALILLAVIAALTVVVVCVSAFSVTDNLSVSISPLIDANSSRYIYHILFGGIDENMSASRKNKLDTVVNDLNSFYKDFENEHEGPYNVEAKYENIDGKTVITFKGEVTDSDIGALVPYEKIFTYDYFLTDKIDAPNNSSLKYFS